MKKLLSLLLVVCMFLSVAPAALADEGDVDVRETDFFDDQPHSDLNFEDMAYVEVTEEEFLAAIDATDALIEADATVDEIVDSFHVVTDLMQTMETNLTLLNIKTSIDVTDEESTQLYLDTYALYLNCFDPFIFLVQDVLDSKAADKMIADDLLTESDIDYYVNYGGMSDEEKAISNEIATISNDYDTAYLSGDLDKVCEIYMKSIDLNNQLVALYPDYDNYAEYAYENVFGRDYTVEDAQAFFDAVKEYIVPLGRQLYFINDFDQTMNPELAESILYADYTGTETLEAIRPYIAKLSSELLETWDYMVGHHLYDIEYRETKYNGGFTTQMSGLGAPFFFNSPYGDLYDFTTIVHEFGHYSNYYWHPHIWNEGSCSYDVAEVHSQALELLFSNFYADIFGDASDIAEGYLFSNMFVSGIINGCLVGELELYAYTTDDVTLEMINEKYQELCGEYGLVGSDYGFVTIPHMTQSPMYYISYATSAIGALTFWNISVEEDLETAVDDYLQFMARPYYDTFQDEFMDICGVNPIDPEYVAEIAENVSTVFNAEERYQTVRRANYYDDVDMDNWFFEEVCEATELGLMQGTDEYNFTPDGTTKRSETVTVIWNMFGNTETEAESAFTDAEGHWYAGAANWAAESGIVDTADGLFNGDETVTREQIAVMLYNAAKFAGADMTVTDTALDSFTDAADLSDSGREPMAWCAANGVFTGNDESALLPAENISRAELASVMVRFYDLGLIPAEDTTDDGADTTEDTDTNEGTDTTEDVTEDTTETTDDATDTTTDTTTAE